MSVGMPPLGMDLLHRCRWVKSQQSLTAQCAAPTQEVRELRCLSAFRAPQARRDTAEPAICPTAYARNSLFPCYLYSRRDDNPGRARTVEVRTRVWFLSYKTLAALSFILRTTPSTPPLRLAKCHDAFAIAARFRCP